MKIKCTPDKGVTTSNIIERTIGRAVRIEPITNPFGAGSTDLLGDIFHALYDTEFEPVKAKEVPVDRQINHALMRWIRQDEEFSQARGKTQGRLPHSLAGAKLLYEYLLTNDAIRAALQVQDEPPEMPMGGSGDGDGEESEQQKRLAQALARMNSLSKNIIGSKIMSIGAQKAEAQADKVDGLMKSWGVEPGDVNISNIDDIMSMMNNNSTKLARIADLAGRFQSVVAKALESTRDSYIGQIVDTKRTRDFRLMYGTSRCYLMSPDVPPLIHAKYVSDYISGGLLGVEKRSEGKEFGSLYIMVDGSGSMGGSMEVYAKSIALGLAKAMNQDSLNNRQYRLGTFGSGQGDQFFTTNSDEDWKSHMQWAERFQGGGTDFNWTFNRAMREIKDMPEGTDFVFITDGQCDLSTSVVHKWKEFKAEHGTRLLYVDVSGYENPKVRELSDLYIRVNMQSSDFTIIADGIATKLAENMEEVRLEKKDED